jgi:nucleotide-binding universal stress UspA family protein
MSKSTYAAVWSDGRDPPLVGSVALVATGIRLEGSSARRQVRLQIRYEDIAGLHLGRENGDRMAGRPALAFRIGDARIRIAVPEPGALHELAETLAELTDGRSDTMKRIVIGTDGSRDALRAVREGLELASELKAHVTFVAVRTPPNAMWGAPVYQAELETSTLVAQKAIDEALTLADDAEIYADYEILDGNAAEAIETVADTWGADYIVVGSRGRGAVKGVLFGSVSKALITHSHRPVLVVKEPKHAPLPA